MGFEAYVGSEWITIGFSNPRSVVFVDVVKGVAVRAIDPRRRRSRGYILCFVEASLLGEYGQPYEGTTYRLETTEPVVWEYGRRTTSLAGRDLVGLSDSGTVFVVGPYLTL